jgi:hypothetical protein
MNDVIYSFSAEKVGDIRLRQGWLAIRIRYRAGTGGTSSRLMSPDHQLHSRDQEGLTAQI